IFRQAKSFFDNPNIEVVGGVSLLKSNEGRQGKAIQDNSIAVETAPTVEARNSEMGTYFMDSAKKFFAERSLNLNLVDTARSVARAIPDDIKADISEIVTEARTLKKKKSLKKLLPLLKIVGVKTKGVRESCGKMSSDPADLYDLKLFIAHFNLSYETILPQ
uniref:Uncharacterized protein n=1 Tax=Megaselia scalaris TaxID=36166 RepID=T1H2H2_MEGSC